MSEATQPLSVFITGGDSSLGLSLVRNLVRRGIRVTATTRQGSQGAYAIRAAGGLPVYPDLSRAGELAGLMKMAQTNVVVYLASQALNVLPLIKHDWQAHADALATEALMQAAANAGVTKVIYTSFAFLYGDQEGHTVTEESALDTSNAFYAAAAAAEANVLAHGGYVLRAGYLYGGHDANVDTLRQALLAGKNLISGAGLAPFTHEEDLAAAILALLEAEAPANHLYNIVDDEPQTSNGFVGALAQALGLGAVNFVPNLVQQFAVPEAQQALLDQSAQVSNARAKAELGWKPQYANIRVGIERMLMHWRAAERPEPAPAPVDPYEAKLAALNAGVKKQLEAPVADKTLDVKPVPVKQAAEAAAPAAEAPKAAAEASDGPKPWTESEADREARKAAALARKAARAEKRGG